MLNIVNNLGLYVGKVALCLAAPRTINLLYNRELLLFQVIEQDLRDQGFPLQIPLAVICTAGLFRSEIYSFYNQSKCYAESFYNLSNYTQINEVKIKDMNNLEDRECLHEPDANINAQL
jgi:hypothetical protein